MSKSRPDRLEAPFAITFRPGRADDMENFRWACWGWKRRHWPADVVRPGVKLYFFDARLRALRILLEITRGGAFTYRTRGEFSRKVERFTGWRPDPEDPYTKRRPTSRGEKFNTGIALRVKKLKDVNIPLRGRFPQLGWLKLGQDMAGHRDVDPGQEFFEGDRRIQRHVRIERDPRLRARARDLWRQRLGRLRCVVCGFDFERSYGEIGSDFIEMHHSRPLSALKGQRATRPAELIPLCPNCHRMIHRQTPFLTVRRLRRAMKAPRGR